MNLLLSILIVMTMALVWEVFRRLRQYSKRVENETRQLALESRLYHVLNIHRSLPPMRGWALSPDTAWEYVRLIFQKQPNIVVECGSGVSTLLAGYALKQLGSGIVIALDHKKAFAQATSEAIKLHGLQNYARIFHAPLKEQQLPERRQLWYDLSLIDLPNNIDILLIDGPPAHLQKQSRFAALPLLKQKLAREACILLDDTNRKDEQHTIKSWMNNFQLEQLKIKSEKGAVLLTIKPSPQPESKHQQCPKL